MTFSAPKSLSIIWATADPELRRGIEDAWDAAVAVGVGYLEGHAIWVRRKRGHEPAAGMVAASFRHGTSRELDPQLHEHVVIANMATAADGRVQTLDGRGLFAHATTAGHLAEAELQHRTAALGLAWSGTRRGIANVDGVPRTAIDAMSTRREQVLNLSAEMGVTTAAGRQIAAVATRAPKTDGVDLAYLRAQWRDRLAAAGFGPAELRHATTRTGPVPWGEQDTVDLDQFLAGADGVTRHHAVFDRRDVICTIVDRVGGRFDAAGIEAHADRWLHSLHVIALDHAGPRQLIGTHGKVDLAPYRCSPVGTPPPR